MNPVVPPAKGWVPIPPLSEVRVNLVTAHEPAWDGYVGRVFRIGYYSRQDGLDCVWLVTDEATYDETVDQAMIRTHFDLLFWSDETDLYGVDRPVIQPRARMVHD